MAEETVLPSVIELPPPQPDTGLTGVDEAVLPKYLPVVPIREGVLFPSTESVLSFGRAISMNAIRDALKTHKHVVLLTQKKATVNSPEPSDLYTVGTLAYIEKTLKIDKTINALVRGISRVKLSEISQVHPFMRASVDVLVDEYESDEETEALVSHLQKEFRKAVHLGKPVEFLNFMKLVGGVTNAELIDQIASTLSITTKQKQQLLEATNVKKRLKKVIDHLNHEMRVIEIERDVMSKTQERFDKHMRDSVLRERLRTIQKELGEEDEEEETLTEYEKKLSKLKLTDDIREKVEKEIKKLRQLSMANPESGFVRSWLDTFFELPWGKVTKDKIELENAEKILNKYHYGLEEVKDRILEFIAVLRLKQQTAAKTNETQNRGKALPTILCFVGPPGVGKTSIGQSIAESLGRKFVKVSLGGIRDEAEIRGHRRTYVGSMPGKIINGIKTAKSLNPVFMLDEVDKIGLDYRGDPSAALLEALDPEQNGGFIDHYLDLPFDLSQAIFITTANTLDTIPPALLDRLEIIRYSGYTDEEKFHIAKDHLWQKVLKANGLKNSQVSITDTTLMYIIHRYTQEAGVRSLERTLHAIARKLARSMAENTTTIELSPKKVRKLLGPEDFEESRLESEDQVGLATGMAWTSVGGDVLFIEVALTPGKGQVKLTGKLGEVMKESAIAALTNVKSNAKRYGISDAVLNKTDVHIHVPEGAVPKDGPSAGITITTAIVSAFTKKKVTRTTAMTGEVTLRGRVLKIGGTKEKIIAALRAGCDTIILPKDNLKDLEKIPKSITSKLTFHGVEHIDEVLPKVLHTFRLA